MSTVIINLVIYILFVVGIFLWCPRKDRRNMKHSGFSVTIQQQSPEHWTVEHSGGRLPIRLVIQALAVHACAIAQNTGTDVDVILDAAREVIHSPDIDMHVEFPGL